MKIFDRRFLQYQLAALKHNKYKNKILYPNILLFAIGIYNRENIPIFLLSLFAIVLLIGFGYYRFNKEASFSKEKFEKVMNKKYKEYQRLSELNKPDPAIVLQKIAFAVELDYISCDEAINEIQKLIKKNPQIKKFANNIILSLHAYQDTTKIPKEYIDYLDKTVKNEVNVNLLSDCMRACIIIKEYNKVISIASKAEEELHKVKKIRKPAYNAIYRTMLVSLPFYKGEAYKALGNRKKAKESYEQALKHCKSKDFRFYIVDVMNNES